MTKSAKPLLGNPKIARLLATASLATMAAAAYTPAEALVARDDVGVNGSVDVNNEWDGVGQMFNRVINPNGTVSTFLCTGQLINPRTVIFAQHCTADRPDEAYDAGNGNHMGFGFNPTDTFTGFDNWRRTPGGAINNPFTDVYSTSEAQLFYNVLQVKSVFNVTEFFPGGDITIATFDTPVADLTSYGLLMSALKGPTHAAQVGYGTTGTGSTGDVVGIDFRRRSGENMIDGLFSQNDFIAVEFDEPGFGFGTAESAQLLYHVDFDKPNPVADDCSRITSGPLVGSIICNTPPFGPTFTLDGAPPLVSLSAEMNWYGGGALARESGTAGGDSGSALFADQLGVGPLITGVLSGGWVTGVASPLGGYADVAYYNPIFVFRDWLVANNPYVYASNKRGSGNWADPTYWVQDMDPNYYYIDSKGNVRNGLESAAQPGYFADDPKWGTVFGTDVSNDFGDPGPDALLCEIDASFPCPPDNSGLLASMADQGLVSMADPDGHSSGPPNGSSHTGPTAGNTGPTGPGSTGFVPNNSFGTYGTWASSADGVARFFDVTLDRSGLTKIRKNEGFEIDHLTLWGDDAELEIASKGVLNVLMNTDLVVGILDVDGTLSTRRLVNTFGKIMGGGTINASHGVYNLGGIIEPYEDDVGSLTINGNFVQAENGWMVMDIGKSSNDRLVVNGAADIAGSVGLRSTRKVRYGERFTLVQATSVTGNFDHVAGTGTLLFGSTIADADSIDLVIDAHSLAKFHARDTEWGSLAQAIDYARDYHYLQLQGVFDFIDYIPLDSMNFALPTLTPINAFEQVPLAVEYQQGFTMGLAGRTSELRAGQRGMSQRSLLAGYRMLQDGAPTSEEGVALSRSSGAPVNTGERLGFFVTGHGNLSDIGNEAYEGDRYNPERMTALSSADLTVGADYRVNENFAIGVASTMSRYVSHMNETTPLDHSGYGVMLYATTWKGDAFVDSYVGVARQDYAMSRIPGMSAAMTTDSAPGAVQTLAGVRAGWTFEVLDGLKLGPTLSVNHSTLSMDGYAEHGGGAFALDVDARTLSSTTVESALEFTFQPSEFGRAKPYGAYGRLGVAQEVGDGADIISARFAAAPDVAFDISRNLDRYWVTSAAGFSYQLGADTSAYLEANSDMGRGALSNESIMIGFNRSF